MPKKCKDPYRKEQLEAALAAVAGGMSKKGAAKKFRVPKATIQFRLSDKFKKTSLGPAPVLRQDEEVLLVTWLKECQRKGQPRRAEDLRLSVKEILDKSKRPNPFKDNKPGEGWYKAFLRRHPDLCIRVAEEVTKASSCVSKDNIVKWFEDVKNSLKEENKLEILEDPNRLFNCDETGFSLNPANGKVIAAKGDRFVYEIDKGPAKTNITVLYCLSASGVVVPPLIVYPYTRIPTEVFQSVVDAAGDEDWGIGSSENGWMTSEVFYEYVGKHFNSFLIKKGIKKPVILFVDGHKTHLTYHLSKLCVELGIVLVVLYPNATRILQPCDVGVFRPLKAAWQRETLSWYRENPAENITKVIFASILKKVLKQISPATAANSFKACGLYPFDSSSINFAKCLGTSSGSSKQEEYLSTSEFLQIMGRHRNILTKEAENPAEMILQKMYAKLSAQPQQSLPEFFNEFDNLDEESHEFNILENDDLFQSIAMLSPRVPSPDQLSPTQVSAHYLWVWSIKI